MKITALLHSIVPQRKKQLFIKILIALFITTSLFNSISCKVCIAQKTLFIKAETPVIDYDGNVYQTIMIGDQIWMAENLRSEHYSDGSILPNCYYNNDTSNINIYGRLYKWEDAMRNATSTNSNPSQVQGACPDGWHIPSDSEWMELIDSLGGESVAGGKLKEEGYLHWNSPNTGATNEIGFGALPTGFRDFTGGFNGLGEVCFYLTSTAENAWEIYIRELNSNSASMYRGGIHPDDAIPIRCVKDYGTSDVRNINKKSPVKLVIHNNYPNPFQESTKIEFTLEKPSHVVLKIYSNTGQLITTLVNNYLSTGTHQVNWNTKDDLNRNVKSGIYCYQIIINSFFETKKMILLE
ncbi:MAG: T9SS type A sorting domain-containing protein [Bacteroidales bacterium]|nr:T9SS type A sorting domain-containing protein [Bacteroidales bacterium]